MKIIDQLKHIEETAAHLAATEAAAVAKAVPHIVALAHAAKDKDDAAAAKEIRALCAAVLPARLFAELFDQQAEAQR